MKTGQKAQSCKRFLVLSNVIDVHSNFCQLFLTLSRVIISSLAYKSKKKSKKAKNTNNDFDYTTTSGNAFVDT